MPTYNFNLKITTGARTPLKVDVYSSCNTKRMEFENSTLITDTASIADQIEKLIKWAIEREKQENPKPKSTTPIF